MFIKKLGGDINCIPLTDEKYISFSKKIHIYDFLKDEKTIHVNKYLRFIDSFKFIHSSLEKMVKNLGEENLYLLKKFFPCEKERSLLTRKGLFPYDRFDS